MISHALTYLPLFLAYGVWGLAVLVALGVAWFVPFLRTPALATAAAIVAGLVCFQLGDNVGAERIRAQVTAGQKQEAKDGEKARDDAIRSVGADSPDVVRKDPANRDNWK